MSLGLLIFRIKAFLKYKFRGVNRHWVHSPFVYELTTQVIESKKHYYAFTELETLRFKLEQDQTQVEIKDFGAGSNIDKSRVRSISDIAKGSSKKKKYGELLFKLVDYYQPQVILELGTCLGMSTLYMAKANSNSEIITIEGDPKLSFIAEENAAKLNCNNIQFICGRFEEKLSKTLMSLSQLDMVFIDGNHTEKATIAIFEQLIPLCSESTILVFDDIHWSPGMEKAWEHIKNHSSVTVTIDLFELGLVYIRPKQVKEHFIIRY